MNTLLIIAHAPLAQALRSCALHVFADCGDDVLAVDVAADDSPEEALALCKTVLGHVKTPGTLVLTDVFGATPCNVAQKLADGVNVKLVSGVNVPMLLRSITYRAEPLDLLVTRAIAGGTQGVMQVANAAPQNQTKRPHDQDPNAHHQ